ncbi:polyubiquitin-like [Myxocyprinus asiaticus]|uniref:polyubiquitin-like n=1 Tax=Myxocyprinus asiaticus TaxID=70543 RepID=UPI0022231D86|nr:polyubiquitin-like [Myxocyprinus asiaticus]
MSTARFMMELEVTRLNGNKKRLTVDSSATVGELKQRISEVFRDHHPSQQKLSANNGRRIDLEDDSRTLSSYGLHSGSTVMLLIKNPGPFQVFVKNEKGSIGTYDVSIDETVEQLQEKIFNKERVPVDQQRLICNGKPLEAGKKLQEYDITSHSTIHMTLRLRGG